MLAIALVPLPALAQDDAQDRIDDDVIINEGRSEIDDLNARQAELSGEIDAIRLSEGEIEAAIAELDDEIAELEAEVLAAHNDQADALREVSGLAAEIEELEIQLEADRASATERIVEAYMRPSRGTLLPLVDSDNIDDLGRKVVYADAVVERDQNLLAAQEETEAELIERQADAADAEADAAAARAVAEEAQEDAAVARAQQEGLRAELESRRIAFEEEVAALEAAEAELQGIIAAREERFRREAAERALWRDWCGDGATITLDDGRVIDCYSLNDPLAPSSLQWPADGPASSEFGPRWGRLHGGLDIAAPTGAPIYAAEGGTAYYVGWISGYGNTILIDHGGGLTTLYGHQSAFAITEGEWVSRGQVIGYIGSTGNSTGPHLHFETRENGVRVDPRKYLG